MKLRNVGFVSVVVGFILMLATTPVITGFVILENFQGSLIIRLVSIILMIGGVVLLASENGDGGLEEKIRSVEFTKSTKRQDKNKIERAIDKIGSGKGNEHPLTGNGKGYWSISADKGARIIYHFNDYGVIVLDRYTADHDYAKVLRGLPSLSA